MADGRAVSSASDSRAASTANGFLIPAVLAPANSASVQPAGSAAATCGPSSLRRWAAVSFQLSLWLARVENQFAAPAFAWPGGSQAG